VNLQQWAMRLDDCAGVGLCSSAVWRVVCDDEAQYWGIQTFISGKTRFFRTVYGAILGFMRLERLSVMSAMVAVLLNIV